MDKQEYRLKTEQMLKHLENKSYKEAKQIADEIEWEKIKNAPILCAVSEIYEHNSEYQKSRDLLFLAYERAPESKKIIYRLGTLALKMNDLKEAVDCYEEFVEMAPNDPNRFIFKYKILRSKKAPLEEQIAVLEEFKKVEYTEKWAFELAQLYKEAGMITEFLEECDDLILWFSEGKYIYEAMELKMQYKPLTPLQHEKYMKRFATEETPAEEIAEEVAEEPVEEMGQEPETVDQEQTEANAEEVVEEEVQEETEEVSESEDIVKTEDESVEEATPDKPTMSIEEIVQDWQEVQKENAQMIQAEIERVEQEKAQNEAEEPEEEKEEILSDDVRKLMEELEAESAEITAQKTVQEGEEVVEEDKPLLQKVVEQLSALDVKIELPGKNLPETPSVPEVIEEIEDPEDEGIKLGDTQSMALSGKTLANAAMVAVPEEDFQEEVQEEEVMEERAEENIYNRYKAA